MDTRALTLLLAAVVVAACDTGRRDTGMEGDTAPSFSFDEALAAQEARRGTLLIGEHRLNFDIELCSIQEPASSNRFMVRGQGLAEDGRRFTVNADSSGQVTAIVVRLRERYNSPVTSYSARIERSGVRIEDRIINAGGEFSRLGGIRQPGQFSAHCGRMEPPVEAPL